MPELKGHSFEWFAVISGLLGAAWVLFIYFRPKARLQRDLSLARSTTEAGLKVPEPFKEHLERRSTDLMDPRPWMIGLSHLFTLFWAVVWVRSALRDDYPWWGRVITGGMGSLMVANLIADLLWAYGPWFRYSQIGCWYDKRFKLMGDSPHGPPRRRELVLWDQRRGKLPPGVIISEPK